MGSVRAKLAENATSKDRTNFRPTLSLGFVLCPPPINQLCSPSFSPPAAALAFNPPRTPR